jgi:hypothetical protein
VVSRQFYDLDAILEFDVAEVSQDTWIYFPWESGQMEPMTTPRKNGGTP